MWPDYCPICFGEIAHGTRICPHCGQDIDVWTTRTPYSQRLIHALANPHPEVRMGAIISLGQRREVVAIPALVETALAYPSDVVQGLEILHTLAEMPAEDVRRQALSTLAADHPAHAVRSTATDLLERYSAPHHNH